MVRLAFIAVLCSLSSLIYASEPVKVQLDMKPHNEWTVNPMLFGSFSEEHWGDITPGIYEQYIVNPSFEDWYLKTDGDGNPEEKSNLVWRNINRTDGVAYPWECMSLSGTARFEQALDSFNTHKSQRVRVCESDTAYVYQRVPLPFYRVKTYKVSFYAKSSGDISLKTFMTTGEIDDCVTETTITGLSGEWKRFDVILELSRQKELHINRYGIYNLGFKVSGNGTVSIDLVTLFPTDCIDGVFNPETIAHFKNYGPTMVRWPGGNFTSGYHWYDGIGKFEDRRSLPNLAWGGLCTNHVGIDEFMRFCELTDVIPVMGVGYNEKEISPKEIADWVEYCNGDVSTPMGALRAKNGHPKPYDVKYWGIGNEVYGSYQIGYQPDPELYASGLIKIVEQIRRVDPSVKVIASAYGAHNHFRKPSDWTEQVVKKAGDHIDFLDIHSYVYGPSLKQVQRSSPHTFFRAFAASNLCIDKYIDDIRALLDKADKNHIKLCFLEWGVLPRVYRSHSIYLPCRQSFVNLLCTGVYLNEFIRNGDFVHMGALHNFSFYVQPVISHAESVNPRTILYKHYNKLGGGKLLDMAVTDMPVYEVKSKWQNIGPHKNVPEIDMLAVKNGKRVYVILINRNQKNTYEIQLEVINGKVRKIDGGTYTSETPYEPYLWRNKDDIRPYVESEIAIERNKRNLTVTVPAMSYTFLQLN